MTIKELSSEFDVLYNNIMSNSAPGLDEYEKSVFLTQAQEQLVLEIYSGTYNGSSFEDTEESRRYISNLIQDMTITEPKTNFTGVSDNSVFFQLPLDSDNRSKVWFRVYEQVKFKDESLGCADNTNGLLKPVTYDEYFKISRNPYKGPNKRRVLRLDFSDDVVEIVSKYSIGSYYVRYLIKPEPIILSDLSLYDMTIDGKSEPNECKLNPLIHRYILDRAVKLAKAAWTS